MTNRYIPPTIRQKTLEVHIGRLYDQGKIHFMYGTLIAVLEDLERTEGSVVVSRLQRILKNKYRGNISRQTLSKWVKVWKEEKSDGA